ncbi:uncharacterized protein LOC9661604 [Selaginella moellendorffii]|uniref:uncharacterized protein LOC9661604 n=1 Tax=Selaginella moellendorffii TaxID=88036 RepID=UPI000D1CA627|nr:uncharacterized protein LOC9661604 [Selaginella moellendorffii]|eukprot:XP_024519109.1 uncharacterized protein LOC9661604 [Selaginella moellendorffii]
MTIDQVHALYGREWMEDVRGKLQRGRKETWYTMPFDFIHTAWARPMIKAEQDFYLRRNSDRDAETKKLELLKIQHRVRSTKRTKLLKLLNIADVNRNQDWLDCIAEMCARGRNAKAPEEIIYNIAKSNLSLEDQTSCLQHLNELMIQNESSLSSKIESFMRHKVYIDQTIKHGEELLASWKHYLYSAATGVSFAEYVRESLELLGDGWLPENSSSSSKNQPGQPFFAKRAVYRYLTNSGDAPAYSEAVLEQLFAGSQQNSGMYESGFDFGLPGEKVLCPWYLELPAKRPKTDFEAEIYQRFHPDSTGSSRIRKQKKCRPKSRDLGTGLEVNKRTQAFIHFSRTSHRMVHPSSRENPLAKFTVLIGDYMKLLEAHSFETRAFRRWIGDLRGGNDPILANYFMLFDGLHCNLVDFVFFDMPDGLPWIDGRISPWNVLTSEHISKAMEVANELLKDSGTVLFILPPSSTWAGELATVAKSFRFAEFATGCLVNNIGIETLQGDGHKLKVFAWTYFAFCRAGRTGKRDCDRAARVLPGYDSGTDVIPNVVDEFKAELYPGYRYRSPFAMQVMLELFCPPDGAVVDATAGCGSMVRAAWNSGRSVLAIEVDPRFEHLLRRIRFERLFPHGIS